MVQTEAFQVQKLHHSTIQCLLSIISFNLDNVFSRSEEISDQDTNSNIVQCEESFVCCFFKNVYSQ